MRFALFSDQHFGPPAAFGGKLRKLSQAAPTLVDALVAELLRVAPDVVVNLGDVIEDEDHAADRARYADFVARLAPLPCVLHVAGNHDTVHLSADDLARLWNHDQPLWYSRDVAGVHFAVLWSQETKDVGVHLPADQLSWLEADLAATELPTVVLVHHPASDCVLTGNRWFERAPHLCRIAERKALRRVIEASRKVAVVCNGHAHWNHLDVCGGIPYVTVQSLIENLDDDAPGRAANASALCTLDARRLLVHVRGAEELRYQLELSPELRERAAHLG